jgi:hypothetical protein
MSDNKETAEQKLHEWAFSSNAFIVPLRTRNTFNEDAFSFGLQLIEEYLELNKHCISYRVLQIIAEIQNRLIIALHHNTEPNDAELTNAILKASYQLQNLLLGIRD